MARSAYIEQVLQKIDNLKIEGAGERPRVILVHNPRSSKADQVEREVLEPLRQIKGITLGKYEVKPTNVDDNAACLAKIINDGDIVVTAGGDGTATIGLNGAVLSGKDIRFMALPFGNFNDMARTLKRFNGKKIYPLEAMVDGKHYRYAACYFTIGMFAESTQIFDGDKMRKKLQKKDGAIFYSLRQLMIWYFKNKRRTFISDFTVNGNLFKKHSDYIAVNGVSVARVMKGNKKIGTDKSNFLSTTKKLTSFFRLCGFMIRSLLFGIPARETKKDRLLFRGGAKIEIQAEGEYKTLESVHEIVISKVEKPLEIL